MSQPEAATAATVAILAAMDDLGPADAKTISEHAGVGYSTAVRKLREWGDKGEIRKTDRGSEPAHWSLLPTDGALPEHLHPAAHPAHPEATGQAPQPEPLAGPADDQEPLDDADDPAEQPPAAAAELDEAADADNITAAAEEPDGEDEGAAEDADGLTTVADAQDDEVSGGLDADEGEQSLPVQEPGDTDLAAAPAEDQEPPDDTGDPAEQPPAAAGPANGARPSRRPKNYFHDEGMAILRANPEREYKIGEMAKLIAAKEIAAGAPAGTVVSTGALSNAMFKAAGAGEAVLTREKPAATFRAA